MRSQIFHSKIILVQFVLLFLAGCNGGSNNGQSPQVMSPLGWDTPVPFFQSGGYSRTAMDNQGNIIIVTWHYNSNNSHYEIIRDEYRNNTWSGPVVISSIPSQPYSSAYRPSVTMDNNGNAIIVWEQWLSNSLIITEYRNGVWSTPRIFNNLNNISGRHSVAMNDQGYAVIAWESNNTIYNSEYINGFWSGPMQISAANKDVNDPIVKINDIGNGIIVWSEDNFMSIASSELVQGVWSVPNTIGSTGNNITTPDLGMDSNGNAIVVWEKSVGTGLRQIYKNEFNNNTWSGEQSVSTSGVFVINSDLALSANGNAVITWQQTNNNVYQIYQTSYTNGNWDTPMPVSLAGIRSINPYIKMDSNGDAILVWNEDNGTNMQVMMSQLIGGSWTNNSYFTISGNSLNPVVFDIDMNSSGNAIFVWGQSDSGTWFEYRSQYH